jgi:hypothetical protein
MSETDARLSHHVAQVTIACLVGGLPTDAENDSNSDGWYWGDIRDALLGTWPGCNMNNGATDCTLGPVQTQLHGFTDL